MGQTTSDLLLDALKNGLTEEAMHQSLLGHFTRLRGAAAEHAARAVTKLTKLVFTYPNFLCDRENDGDHLEFVKYFHTFLNELQPDVEHRWQVTKESVDSTLSSSHKEFYKLLDEVENKENGVNLFAGGRRGGAASTCKYKTSTFTRMVASRSTNPALVKTSCPVLLVHVLTEVRTSAVLAGAALAVMDIPSAEQVLQGSAIGIQKIIYRHKKLSNGDKKGIFLFGARCGPL
ncbi:hypothetical protein DHEL01_v212079 [Diaporthe helianthi]|uniref:Uncharacterized protein n=1 Tax=Diaporthe helianthi TaxID=158607 RepID=A0A2P5HH03_DIAHE|nr:hypothetical protein DHEL01_v212079 [Diaporthe helianthi]